MKEIKNQGYLLDKNSRRLIRKKELLDKWIAGYAEKLRPKKLIGRFTSMKPDFWQNAEIDQFDAQWGGEVAAYRLTRYLKPEILTIYTKKPVHDITVGLKLRQDNNGNIELRERFWNFQNPELDKTMVPPLLVYADLLGSGDSRNIETAGVIYHDYLERILSEE
jgi:hypothetical protein